jgi:hypothetical protein
MRYLPILAEELMRPQSETGLGVVCLAFPVDDSTDPNNFFTINNAPAIHNPAILPLITKVVILSGVGQPPGWSRVKDRASTSFHRSYGILILSHTPHANFFSITLPSPTFHPSSDMGGVGRDLAPGDGVVFSLSFVSHSIAQDLLDELSGMRLFPTLLPLIGPTNSNTYYAPISNSSMIDKVIKLLLKRHP